MIERLENSMIDLFEEMASKNHPVELLMELKFVTLKAIVDIFIGPYNQKRTNKIANLCRNVYEGVFSLPINVPGFAFHRAMKVRFLNSSRHLYVVSNFHFILFFKIRRG